MTDVYQFVDRVIQRSRDSGREDLARKLENAMYLGSSALEILGAVKNIVLEESTTIGKLVDPTDIGDVVGFVDKAFGTQ